MPTGDPDGALASLLRDARSATGRGTTTLFLEFLEPDIARSLRLCAIPHEFDPAILQILQPELSAQEAQRRCEEMAELSLVAVGAAGLSLHEILRRELFAEWLGREHHFEFTAASRGLTDYFRALAISNAGEAKESARRRSMYHLVGADPAAGIEEFRSLFREARDQYRLSDCESLVRLVHEYDAVLAPEHATALAYEQAKLASDQGRWEKASQLLEGILRSDAAAPRLRARAQVRLGMVFAGRGQRRAAIDAYGRAEQIARAHRDAADVLPRIQLETGLAFRDENDLDQAEKLISESVEGALRLRSSANQAAAVNSLGLLYLRRGEHRRAVETFRKCLEVLGARPDAIRISQIYGNLAAAHGELGEWKESEGWFRQALEIKRRSGDVLGQAMTLNNMARTQAQQQQTEAAVGTESEAASLFEKAGDLRLAALARRNLAKYYRTLGKADLAAKSYTEAIALYEKTGDRDEQAATRAELAGLKEHVGIPWWAWGAVVLAILLVAAFIAAIALIND